MSYNPHDAEFDSDRYEIRVEELLRKRRERGIERQEPVYPKRRLPARPLIPFPRKEEASS